MQPAKNGRHCESCQKDVIDFSVMNDEDVQNYFIKNKNSGTCGRFKNTQLDRIRINIPAYVFQKKINPWKKYLLILLLCFGSTVFSVDVFIGNGNLYAQTQKRKAHLKKKKHNLKIHSVNSKSQRIEIPNMTIYTAGFTQTTPVEPIPGIPMDKWETVEERMARYKKVNAKYPALAINSTTNDKEKPPQKSEPVDKMEFILPVPLGLRKRLVKK